MLKMRAFTPCYHALKPMTRQITAYTLVYLITRSGSLEVIKVWIRRDSCCPTLRPVSSAPAPRRTCLTDTHTQTHTSIKIWVQGSSGNVRQHWRVFVLLSLLFQIIYILQTHCKLEHLEWNRVMMTAVTTGMERVQPFLTNKYLFGIGILVVVKSIESKDTFI